MQIRSDGALVVRAPLGASQEYIEKFICKKKQWIQNRRNQAIERKKLKPVKKFVDKEKFMYLGKAYPLYIGKFQSDQLCFDGKFLLPKEHKEKAKELFIKWYKKKAKEVIKQRVALYSKQVSTAYKRIRITDASRRWGSCSQKGDLNFSWRIVMAPLRVLDYIVVHEMVHLLEKNHSKRFWERVGIHFPDYKACRNWLKEKGFSLTI